MLESDPNFRTQGKPGKNREKPQEKQGILFSGLSLWTTCGQPVDNLFRCLFRPVRSSMNRCFQFCPFSSTELVFYSGKSLFRLEEHEKSIGHENIARINRRKPRISQNENRLPELSDCANGTEGLAEGLGQRLQRLQRLRRPRTAGRRPRTAPCHALEDPGQRDGDQRDSGAETLVTKHTAPYMWFSRTPPASDSSFQRGIERGRLRRPRLERCG